MKDLIAINKKNSVMIYKIDLIVLDDQCKLIVNGIPLRLVLCRIIKLLGEIKFRKTEETIR